MIRDVLLVVGFVLSTHLAIEHARGARMLVRAARWPKADHREIGALVQSYIGATIAYSASAVAAALAIAARHA